MPRILANSESLSSRFGVHHLDLIALHSVARLEAGKPSEKQAALSAPAHPLHAQLVPPDGRAGPRVHLLLIPQHPEAEGCSYRPR